MHMVDSIMTTVQTSRNTNGESLMAKNHLTIFEVNEPDAISDSQICSVLNSNANTNFLQSNVYNNNTPEILSQGNNIYNPSSINGLIGNLDSSSPIVNNYVEAKSGSGQGTLTS